MKKMLVKIRDLAEEKLRGVCAGLSPEKRVITIVVLTVLFAVKNPKNGLQETMTLLAGKLVNAEIERRASPILSLTMTDLMGLRK